MHYVCYLLQRLAECRLVKSESGVTAIEYALIAAFVGLAIVAGATAVGVSLLSFFSNLASRIPTG